MTTFLHSGGCGDIIYSLPLVKRMGGGVLYIKKHNVYNHVVDQYEQLKRLLESQEYIEEIRPYPSTGFFQYDESIEIDVDLDKFRNTRFITTQHLIQSYFGMFNMDVWDWCEKWIEVDAEDFIDQPYVVINRTPRYQDPKVDWKKIYYELKYDYKESIYFIGLDNEYEDFCALIGENLNRVKTPDLYTAAQIIKGSEGIWCNQSVCLTIAQSMGQHVNLEVAPGFLNCITGKLNERLL